VTPRKVYVCPSCARRARRDICPRCGYGGGDLPTFEEIRRGADIGKGWNDVDIGAMIRIALRARTATPSAE
jgi:hypothetical protein